MSKKPENIILPSQVTDEIGFFDRFASWGNMFTSRAPFFAFCLLLVIVWAPSYFFFGDIDTWQLIINTITTVVTFLLVALLQNGQTRNDMAMQHKLNAIAEALANFIDNQGEDYTTDATELRVAVGLEQKESTT